MSSDPTTPAATITLLDTIAILQEKRIAAEIEEGHRTIVAHLVKRGGKGRITLTFDYERAEEGLNITPDVTVKLPKKSRRKQFVYADDAGKTYLEPPTQTELAFPGGGGGKLTIVKPAAAAR